MRKFQFLLFVLKQSYICYYIICMTVPLNKVGVLVKSVLNDLRARNFVHAKTSLRARCAHARHHARNLSSPTLTIKSNQFSLSYSS